MISPGKKSVHDSWQFKTSLKRKVEIAAVMISVGHFAAGSESEMFWSATCTHNVIEFHEVILGHFGDNQIRSRYGRLVLRFSFNGEFWLLSLRTRCVWIHLVYLRYEGPEVWCFRSLRYDSMIYCVQEPPIGNNLVILCRQSLEEWSVIASSHVGSVTVSEHEVRVGWPKRSGILILPALQQPRGSRKQGDPRRNELAAKAYQRLWPSKLSIWTCHSMRILAAAHTWMKGRTAGSSRSVQQSPVVQHEDASL